MQISANFGEWVDNPQKNSTHDAVPNRHNKKKKFSQPMPSVGPTIGDGICIPNPFAFSLWG